MKGACAFGPRAVASRRRHSVASSTRIFAIFVRSSDSACGSDNGRTSDSDFDDDTFDEL